MKSHCCVQTKTRNTHKTPEAGSSNKGKPTFVAISTQHAETQKARPSKEAAEYYGSEENVPSMDDMHKPLKEKIIKKAFGEVILKNDGPALTVDDDHTPPDKVNIGGVQGGAVLHGREADHLGGRPSHTSLDRSRRCWRWCTVVSTHAHPKREHDTPRDDTTPT